MNSLLSGGQVSLIHARSLLDHSVFNHLAPIVVAFSRYPSARQLPVSTGQISPPASRLIGDTRPKQVSYRTDWSFHLQLLSTPPRGDAVAFGYRPESVCLKRTFTSLTVRALSRTGIGILPMWLRYQKGPTKPPMSVVFFHVIEYPLLPM